MVTVTLPREIEERLQGEASRQGIGPSELAARLITERFAAPRAGNSLDELFARWAQEDHTSDPAEIARREQDLIELKQAINRNREEMEGPNSRKPFP